jgi:excinuclease ABC subunit B
VLEQVQRPALVIAPNKTLGAQLANEFRDFLPDNAVEYFVSYYDYYQPEAYVPASDTYIEKDSSINDEIDRLRHRATMALLSRRDVVVVASVSCIYGLGSPQEYEDHILWLRSGEEIGPRRLAAQARRPAVLAQRPEPRARHLPGAGRHPRGVPRRRDKAVRVEFFGDEIDRISRVDTLTGEVTGSARKDYASSRPPTTCRRRRPSRGRSPASRTSSPNGSPSSRGAGKLLEAQRLRMRTNYDLEMIREVGFCNGIENYSRHFDGAPRVSRRTRSSTTSRTSSSSSTSRTSPSRRSAGCTRATGPARTPRRARVPAAVALDNRPLTLRRVPRARRAAALHLRDARALRAARVLHGRRADHPTDRPGRPRGRGPHHQGADRRPHGGDPPARRRDERVLVTTLTKKMAEDLTDYLLENGVRVRYLHSDIDTVQRVEILRSLRLGEFDVLVGINLLREGLDLPEVSLVAILDADKEGFLRSGRR